MYLDDGADVQRAIRYVEDNPVKQRRPRQACSFVRGLLGRDSADIHQTD